MQGFELISLVLIVDDSSQPAPASRAAFETCRMIFLLELFVVAFIQFVGAKKSCLLQIFLCVKAVNYKTLFSQYFSV